jgi:multidrug efflux pump subunit AcrB
MWIVQLALRRPYTFVIMALLILILGVLAIQRMPTDILPDIDIPVVSVIWTFNGVSPEEMSEVITLRSQRGITIAVNDIEHLESASLPGLGIIKVFFHPRAKIEAAVAQLSAITASSLRTMPTGTLPPTILRYNASNVPILQLSISSDTLSEPQLYDYGYNFIRTQMATVQGATFPLPYGGKPRQISVDLVPAALYAQGLSAEDVVTAVNAQSLILPSGSVKIGGQEYAVRLNSAPDLIAAFNRLPIRQTNGTTVYVGDVAHVRDGYAVQTNIVRHNGARAALLTVLKNGGSSTLDIVARLKQVLPRIQSTLPASLKLTLLSDQSVFVRSAIAGVVREAVIAAMLTGLMILLFLGSWRSTLIVCCSIPLSILTSLAVLYLLNQTINVMTLGGLALAVGILVDDATVTIENIHRNLGLGKPLLKAILDGAMEIATPAFVSTLCISIVFFPIRLPDRRGALSFFSPGAGGGAGHDGVLPVVPHAGPHHGDVPVGRRSREPLDHRFSALVRETPRGLSGCPGFGLGASPVGGRELRPAGVRLPGAGPVSGREFLPAGGCRPDPPSRARPRRNAHRRNRALLRPGGSRHPARDSSRRAHRHS